MDSFVFNAEHVRLCESSTRNMRQANCKRTQRSVTSPGTAKRRNTSALVPSNRSRHILELFGANLPGRRLVSGAHYRYVKLATQPLKHQSKPSLARIPMS